jgi:hypothetical protein
MSAASTAQTLLLEDCLHQLTLPTILAQYRKAAQAAAATSLPYEQYLFLLAE